MAHKDYKKTYRPWRRRTRDAVVQSGESVTVYEAKNLLILVPGRGFVPAESYNPSIQ